MNRAMPEVIDAHVHVGPTKYRPIEDYLDAMREHGLRRAVLVQHLGNEDNTYLEDCVRSHPGRFAAVGLVDPASPEAPARIAALARRGVIRGVRIPATTRTPGNDPLAVWRTLAEHDLMASVCGPFPAVVDDSFLKLVNEFPHLHVRLEHLGGIKLADDPLPHRMFQRFLRHAERHQTSTTWSGYFLNAATPYPYPDAEPFLRMSLDAFGAERIMWSGDWNRPDLGENDYHAAITHVTNHMAFLNNEQRAWILNRTAATIFGLNDAQ